MPTSHRLFSSVILALLLAGSVLSLTACGQKGDLFLPGDDPDEQQADQ